MTVFTSDVAWAVEMAAIAFAGATPAVRHDQLSGGPLGPVGARSGG